MEHDYKQYYRPEERQGSIDLYDEWYYEELVFVENMKDDLESSIAILEGAIREFGLRSTDEESVYNLISSIEILSDTIINKGKKRVFI